MLVKSFVETYDRSGGKIVLPPMWKTTTTYTTKAKPAKAAPRAKAAEPKAKKKTRSR
jgi:hypothetical protein